MKRAGALVSLGISLLVSSLAFAGSGYEMQNATPQEQGAQPGMPALQPGTVVVPGAVAPGSSGQTVILEPGIVQGAQPGTLPSSEKVSPESSPSSVVPVLQPEQAAGPAVIVPGQAGETGVVQTPQTVVVQPSVVPSPETASPAREAESVAQPAQVWQLLPLQPATPEATLAQTTPETSPEKKQPEKAGLTKPEAKAPEKEKPKKPEPKKPEAKKPEPKAPEKKQPQKAKPGDPLQIPPEAVQTGSLAFLEGCWQGTRPEYETKRIIKECFCFDANGQGRRFIDDFAKRKKYTGSAQASLGGGGVLHVSSARATGAGRSGWSASEMTCRGSGQRTPCSWEFVKQNGYQSYEIEFIRVNSCGR